MEIDDETRPYEMITRNKSTESASIEMGNKVVVEMREECQSPELNALKEDDVSEYALQRPNNERIAFRDLKYTVTTKRFPRQRTRTLLKDLNGYIPLGSLTAVIGQSGAGKTTFLEILSGVPVSGKVQGTVTRNVDAQPLDFAMINQTPTLPPNETVEEVIRFGCNVYNDHGLNKEIIKIKVNRIINDFNLQKVRKSLISTLSGGEKKRVSIARHCAGDPKVMVLDEPTSGLDTFNAFNMMRILKNLCANEQCTIILSIHQPQKRIVDLFDYLISFKDGRLVFQGQLSEAITSRSALLKKIDLNAADCKYHPGDHEFIEQQIKRSESELTNECEFLLETEYLFTAQSLADELALQKFGDVNHVQFEGARNSEIQQKLFSKWCSTCNPKRGWRAFTGLLGRESRENRRNILRIPSILVVHALCAVFFGLIYGKMSLHMSDIQNRFGALAFVALFTGVLSIAFVGTLYEGRAIYIEERNSKMYGAIPYLTARIIPSILLMRVIPTIVASVIMYKMMGLQDNDEYFGHFVVICVLLSMVSTLSVMAISSISSSVYQAASSSILFNLLLLLFSGVFTPNEGSVPAALRWMKYLSFYQQALEVMMVHEFHGLDFIVDEGTVTVSGIPIDVTKDLDVTIPCEFFLKLFGMNPDRVSLDYTLLIVAGTVYFIIALLALQYMHRTSR